MTDKYILGGDDGRTPVPVNDLMVWAHWFETANRRVAVDHVGPYRVSTVFIGLNHAFSEEHPPLLFETMVFEGQSGGRDMERCSTWDEAVELHELIVARLKRELSG